jgi:hypothetical protein
MKCVASQRSTYGVAALQWSAIFLCLSFREGGVLAQSLTVCTADEIFVDNCPTKADGFCDAGSMSSVCSIGTDCVDCDPCRPYDDATCETCIAASCVWCVKGNGVGVCSSATLAAALPLVCVVQEGGTEYTSTCWVGPMSEPLPVPVAPAPTSISDSTTSAPQAASLPTPPTPAGTPTAIILRATGSPASTPLSLAPVAISPKDTASKATPKGIYGLAIVLLVLFGTGIFVFHKRLGCGTTMSDNESQRSHISVSAELMIDAGQPTDPVVQNNDNQVHCTGCPLTRKNTPAHITSKNTLRSLVRW